MYLIGKNNRTRRAAALITVIALAASLALSGCAQKSGGEQGSPAPDGVIKARETVEVKGEPLKYLYSNNITRTDSTLNGESFSGSYIVISGLEDAAVQKKINDTIRAKFLELAVKEEIPPYTGWKIRFRDMSERDRSVHTYVYGDFNNILSMQIYCWRYFTRGDDEYSYGDGVTDVAALNFDLRTGDLLTLKDVFRSDVDYIAYLDSYMEKFIAENDCYEDTEWGWGDQLDLSGPFRGVDPDQQFLLNDYTGTVRLVFDYKDPEVVADYPVYINIADTSALDLDKFMEGGLAAADKTLSFKLVRSDYPVENNPYENEPLDLGGRDINYESRIASYPVLTDAQKKFMAERSEDTSKLAEKLIDAYDSFKQRYGEDRPVYAYIEESADCGFYGPYRVITRNCYCYAAPEFLPEEEYEYYSDSFGTRYAVFRGDSDVPLSIEDMFKEGTDWKAAVISAARKRLDSMGAPVYFDFDAYAREYLGRMTGFSPYVDSLQLEFGDTSDIDARYLAMGDEYWYYSSSLMYLEYSLFDDCLDL